MNRTRSREKEVVLTPSDCVDGIIDQNAFSRSVWKNKPSSIQQVMDFYLIERENIPLADGKIKKRAIDAFEKSRSQEISKECHQLLYGN